MGAFLFINASNIDNYRDPSTKIIMIDEPDRTVIIGTDIRALQITIYAKNVLAIESIVTNYLQVSGEYLIILKSSARSSRLESTKNMYTELSPKARKRINKILESCPERELEGLSNR